MSDSSFGRMVLRIALCVSVIFMVTATTVCACSVAVFRYALLEWEPDLYQVEVVGQLPVGGQLPAMGLLEDSACDGNSPANVLIRHIDTEQVGDIPQIRVFFPEVYRPTEPFYVASLTIDAVQGIVDSPVRRELVRSLAAGDAAVWLFLESGDRRTDDAAAGVLSRELANLPAELARSVGPPDVNEGSAVAIKFSMIRVSRRDPNEVFLIESLLHTEVDLAGFAGPIAFPVFGRGRVLYALVGEGINPDAIWDTCVFLVGACSCVVKVQNPGCDLLLSANWQRLLESSAIVQGYDLPLVGITADLVVANDNDVSAWVPFSSQGPAGERPACGVGFWEVVLCVLGLAFVCVSVGTLAICRRRGG